jgi:hypothetical protein
MSYIGWHRQHGRGRNRYAWRKVCSASSESACWAQLLDWLPRLEQGDSCVLAEAELPPAMQYTWNGPRDEHTRAEVESMAGRWW